MTESSEVIVRVLALVVLVSFACCRVAMAGDVVAVTKSGKLVLQGDADGNVVAIDTVAVGSLRVVPAAGTTVNGAAAPASFTVTGGITASLGAGDDRLTLAAVPLAGDLKLEMGDGFDTLVVRGSDVAGAAILDFGTGAAALAFCDSSTDKAVKLKAGATGPGIATATCAGVANADLSTTDGVAAVFGNALIGGSLGFKVASGAAKLVSANSNVTGTTTVVFGNGSLQIGLCDASFGDDVTVTMQNGTTSDALGCEVSSNSANVTAAHGVVILGSTLVGSFTMKSGKGVDAVVTDVTSFGDELTLSLGSELNVVVVNGQVGNALSVKGGKDVDIVLASTLTVGESTKLTLGDGNNTVDLGTATIGGDLTVKTGSGDDLIVANECVVGGRRVITPGTGTNTLP